MITSLAAGLQICLEHIITLDITKAFHSISHHCTATIHCGPITIPDITGRRAKQGDSLSLSSIQPCYWWVIFILWPNNRGENPWSNDIRYWFCRWCVSFIINQRYEDPSEKRGTLFPCTQHSIETGEVLVTFTNLRKKDQEKSSSWEAPILPLVNVFHQSQ